MKLLMIGGTTALLFSATIVGVNAQTFRPTSVNQQQPQLIAQNMAGLMAMADDGTPKGITEERWLKANATVSTSPVSNGKYQVTVQASGLVPNGLYTFWWVNKKLVGMDMGPAGGVEGNSFRADKNGNATKTITVPADNNYQMLVAAYHADNQTHGEMPGKMGEETFGHFSGPFPQAK